MTIPPSPSSAYRSSRLLFFAIGGAPLLFWGVAFALAGDRVPSGPEREALGNTLFWAWLVLGLGGFAAALVLRGQVVQMAYAAGRGGSSSGEGGLQGPVMSKLIMAWALLEMPAILGGIYVLVTGNPGIAGPALGIFLLGLVLTYPRREWFVAPPR